MIIRLATLEDMTAVTDIYNDAILHTNNSFDTIPKTVEDRQQWYRAHMPTYPILVAEEEGAVVGFSAISPWSDRPAYGRTVLASVYIHLQYRGQGVGKTLLQAILAAAYEAGFHTVMGNIYAGNPVSLHMVESIGFRTVGLLKEVGYKFGQWRDVYLVQHMNSTTDNGRLNDEPSTIP